MKFFNLRVLASILAFIWSVPILAQEETVDWLNNYKEAIAEAKRTQKPIFLEYRCEA
jgi:hypothetical protein